MPSVRLQRAFRFILEKQSEGLTLIAKLIDWPFTVLKTFAACCLIAMIVMVFGNVVLRYAFNSGITISDEMSRYCFVWLTYIGAMVAIFRGGHGQENKKKKNLLHTARTQVAERLMNLLDNMVTDHRPLDRLHLFAANHIPSAVKLAPYCTSMDSSAWLRAARYGYMFYVCLLYTSPSPRDRTRSRMPSSA